MAATIAQDAASAAGQPTGFAQQLVWHEEVGSVVVTPRDQDRFCVKLHKAIEALQKLSRAEEFGKQFRLLMRVVAEWIRGRPEVAKAYLTLRDGALMLIVVRSTVRYDADFEDALSDLDLRIAEDADLNLIRISSLALPQASDEAVASFLHPEFTLEFVHGAAAGSHRTGEQEP